MQLALAGARRAAPFAVVLALSLGGVLALGSELSTAYPSAGHPFGWPGRAHLDNAVAMVRSDLVLATTLPALLAGATVLSKDEEGPLRRWLGAALALLAGAFVGVGAGALYAASADAQAFWALAVATTLLALAFLALGFLCASLAPRRALPVALVVWVILVVAYDHLVNWRAFREVGFHRLAAGDFPTWFYVAQAASPLTAYRGVLILWRPQFMDGLEKAVLGGAVMPAWMTPAVFGTLLALVWIAIPLGLALLAWHARARRASPPLPSRSAKPGDAPTGGDLPATWAPKRRLPLR